MIDSIEIKVYRTRKEDAEGGARWRAYAVVNFVGSTRRPIRGSRLGVTPMEAHDAARADVLGVLAKLEAGEAAAEGEKAA